MKPRRRKSGPEEVLESTNALTALGDRFQLNRLIEVPVIVTGTAALTVGSTAILSLRRRMEATL